MPSLQAANRLERALSRFLSWSKVLPGSLAGFRFFWVLLSESLSLDSASSSRDGASDSGQFQGVLEATFVVISLLQEVAVTQQREKGREGREGGREREGERREGGRGGGEKENVHGATSAYWGMCESNACLWLQNPETRSPFAPCPFLLPQV